MTLKMSIFGGVVPKTMGRHQYLRSRFMTHYLEGQTRVNE